MTKAELRAHFMAQRLRLSDAEHQKKSHEINRRLLYQIPRDIRFVHTFLPNLPKGEVNLWPLIRIAIHWEIPICVPVVRANREMDAARYDNEVELQQKGFGVLEPVNPELIDPELIDVVLVPLIAFDSKGYRVGYGGGYYDRFLSRIPRAKTIGVSLFPPVERISDLDQFDIPLDMCVTPEGMHNWKRSK